MSDEPIGGDTKVTGIKEHDYYNSDENDFDTRKLAQVAMGDDVSANDIGKVVDLLNEYDADEIRTAVMQE